MLDLLLIVLCPAACWVIHRANRHTGHVYGRTTRR